MFIKEQVMSKEEMDRIIERAASDSKFRKQLLEDASTACESYDITGEELSQIITAAQETFAGELDVRVSKRKIGKFGGFTGPMGIDDIIE